MQKRFLSFASKFRVKCGTQTGSGEGQTSF